MIGPFGTPSQAKFAKLMTRTLRWRGDTRTIEYNADLFYLVIGVDDDQGGYLSVLFLTEWIASMA